jgi:hypothetical protein
MGAIVVEMVASAPDISCIDNTEGASAPRRGLVLPNGAGASQSVYKATDHSSLGDKADI